jgi:hypothetical protein
MVPPIVIGAIVPIFVVPWSIVIVPALTLGCAGAQQS